MDEDNLEKILFKILDYQSNHKVNDDSILIMLSLLNLMGMVDALNSDRDNGATDAGSTTGLGNMEALLVPLMALMASGMGKGGAAGGEGQSPFNPAALLSILSGVLAGNQGKGGAPDLSALLKLLGPLLGMGGVAQNQSGAGDGQAEKRQPVEREINLDEKYKASAKKTVGTEEGAAGQKKERLPKPGEVLKWEFGT